jgi:hypothetical protein
MDGALEQRATQDLGCGGELKLGGDLFSFADGLVSRHQ